MNSHTHDLREKRVARSRVSRRSVGTPRSIVALALVSGLGLTACGGVDTLAGAQSIDLTGLAMDSESVGPPLEPGALEGPDNRIPHIVLEGMTRVDFKREVRHGYPPRVLDRHATDTRADTWIASHEPGEADQVMAELVDALEGELRTLNQRGVEILDDFDDGAILVRPKSEPDDNPYWFSATVTPLPDNQISVRTTSSIGENGTFEQTAADVLPSTHRDKLDLLEPLLSIDGVLLSQWTVDPVAIGAGGINFEIDDAYFEVDDEIAIDCDEFAAAFESTVQQLLEVDPTMVETEQTAGSDDALARRVEGDVVAISTRARCEFDGTVDRIGTYALVAFRP